MSFRNDGTGYSQTYSCILSADNGLAMPDFCKSAQYPAAVMLQANLATTTLDQLTQVLSGSIASNQNLTRSLYIDSSQASQFHLSWASGPLALTLIDPNGGIIDPDYAALHPDQVSYHFLAGGPDVSPQVTYYFTNTLQGAWQLKLSAGDVGAGVAYNAFAALQSDRKLTFETNKEAYAIGETAQLTATLQNQQAGIPGASVSVTLTRSDASSQVITLLDQGNGMYTGSYSIPDAPGYLAAQVNADGVDNGVIFSRHVDWIGTIFPGVLELTGVYDGQARNDNGDALYETYDLAVEVSAAQQTQATFVANLAADGTVVASAYQQAVLSPGKQIVHLEFAGDDIRHSHLDGPYTVTKLSVIDTSLGVPVYTVENPITTGSYTWQMFGGCHPLDASVLPDVADR